MIVDSLQLKGLIWLTKSTHVYWCPVGGHWGVVVQAGPICPMGCNYPPIPGSMPHRPEEAQ